jgi:hypothetical protein
MKNKTKAFQYAAYTMLGAIILFATVRVVLAATNLDFKLHNHTEKAIHHIYISGHDDNQWGEDVLGKDVLEEDEATEIKFSEGTAAATYDMKVEFEDKSTGVWPSLDLTQITDITLFYKDGVPYAKKENK